MDELQLATIEKRIIAHTDERILLPVRINLLYRVATEDALEMTAEIRRCWQRIVELEAEVARLKAANHHARLLRRQAAINARLTELSLRGASLQDPERMRLESELGELVEEIERMEAPDGR